MWYYVCSVGVLLFNTYDQTPVLKPEGAIAQADSGSHLLLAFSDYAGSDFLGVIEEVFCDPPLQAYQVTLIAVYAILEGATFQNGNIEWSEAAAGHIRYLLTKQNSFTTLI